MNVLDIFNEKEISLARKIGKGEFIDIKKMNQVDLDYIQYISKMIENKKQSEHIENKCENNCEECLKGIFGYK